MAKEIKEPDKLNNEVLEDAEIEALYKASLEAEVPDFWDKIEAGIKAEVKTDNVVSFDNAKQKAVEKLKDKNAAKPKRNMRPYMGLIAAAVLMIIIAVPIFLSGLGDRKKLESEKKAEDTTAAFDMDSMESAMSDSAAKNEAVAGAEAMAEAAEESAAEAPVAEATTAAPAAEDFEDAYESAGDDAELNFEDGKSKTSYNRKISGADAQKIVIVRGNVVVKGDKYIIRDVKNEGESVKLDKDEYEIENPDDMVKYMEEYDGEILVWVCALHDDKLYVYGPAED